MGVDILEVTELKVLLHFGRSSGDDDVEKHVSEMHSGEGLGDKNIMDDIMVEERL